MKIVKEFSSNAYPLMMKVKQQIEVPAAQE